MDEPDRPAPRPGERRAAEPSREPIPAVAELRRARALDLSLDLSLDPPGR